MRTESLYIKNQLLAEAIVGLRRRKQKPNKEKQRVSQNIRNTKLKAENAAHKANLLAKRIAENKRKWYNFYMLISKPEFADWYYSMTGIAFVVDDAMADVMMSRFNIDWLIEAYNKNLVQTALDDLFALKGYSSLEPRLRRRVMQALATPAWADMTMIKAIYAQRDLLNGQGGERYEVDHCVPILGEMVCGLHVHTNLRVITAIDNKKKRNLLTAEFI